MKRLLLFVVCAQLTGCMGMEPFCGEEFVGYQVAQEPGCPCQSSGASAAAPRVMPVTPTIVTTSGQLPPGQAIPSSQTREPDLLPSR